MTCVSIKVVFHWCYFVALDVGVGFKAFAHEYENGLRSVTLGASIIGIGGEIEFNRNSIMDYNFGLGTGFYAGFPGANVHSLDFSLVYINDSYA